MKKTYKNIIFSILTLSLMIINSDFNNTFAAPAVATKPQAVAYLTVSPIDVVNCPSKYLNKNISFSAEFVAFTSLGLDYKPAFRDGTKYIGILIKRPDVKDHTIPLSEMKIFIKRELAEKYTEIDAGDIVKISGKVFSTALGDPWVDASTFVITKQKSTKKDK